MNNIYIIRLKSLAVMLILSLVAVTGLAQTVVTFPAGNPLTGTDRKPLGVYFGYERSDMIYTAAEHTIPNNSLITRVSFYLESNNGSPPPLAYNVKIYFKQVGTTSSVTISPYSTATSGATLVYDGFLPPNTWSSFPAWVNFPIPNYLTNGQNLEVMVETNWFNSTNDPDGWFPAPGTASAILFRQNTGAANVAQYWNKSQNAVPIGPPISNGVGSPVRPNIQFTYFPSTACGGPPAGLTAITNSNPVCTGTPFALTLNNIPAFNGYSYQWFSSSISNTGPWSLIAGATSAIYQTTLTDTMWYYCRITCGSQTNSSVVQVNQNSVTNCYCTSGAISALTTDIGNVTFSTINNGVAVPVTGNSTAVNTYSDFTSTVPPPNLTQGANYPISITQISNSATTVASYGNAFIDYNRDGIFDPAYERVFSAGSTSPGNPTLSGSVTIPFSSATGRARMRILLDEASPALNYVMPGAPDNTPCGLYTRGETEDYDVMLVGGAGCTSPVIAGTAVSSAPNVCPSQQLILSLTGNTTAGVGQTWQWDSSTTGCGGVWYPIAGANLHIYVTQISATTSYRCRLSCGASTGTSSCVTVTANLGSQCYCGPPSGQVLHTPSCASYRINGVQINTLNNVGTGCTSGNGNAYTIYPASGITTTSLTQNSTYNLTVTTAGSSQSISVWIDYNANGVFEVSEWYGLTGSPPVASAAGPYSIAITIPATTATGLTGMRVRSRILSGANNDADDACTRFGSGETEDYLVTLVPFIPPPCTGPPAIGAVSTSASAASVCAGTPVNLSLLPASATNFSGLSYQWQFDTAGIWNNIPGAPNSKTMTTSQARYTRYRCIITCGTSTPSNPVTVDNNPIQWLGFTSDWADGGNWCGRVPTLADSVQISLTASGRPAALYMSPVVAFTDSAKAYNLQLDVTDSLTVLTDSLVGFRVDQHVINNGAVNFTSTYGDTLPFSSGAIISGLYTPFRGGISDQVAQFLYSETELTDGGMVANDIIDSLFFHFRQQTSTKKYQGFRISYGFTLDDQFSSTVPYTGLTQIYYKDSLFVDSLVPGTFGTMKLPVTGFTWDGVSNIILQICFNTVNQRAGANDFLYASTTPDRQYLQLSIDVISNDGCALTGSTPGVSSNFTPAPTRPNITFRFHRPQRTLAASMGSVTYGGGFKNNGSLAKLFVSNTNLTITGTLNSDGAINVDTSTVTITGDFLNNSSTDLSYSPMGFQRKSQMYFTGINWSNNGIFIPGTKSRVVFAGSATQTLGGFNPTTFWDFRMEKSAAANQINLTRSITVNDTLSLGNGRMLLNGNTIIITNSNTWGIKKDVSNSPAINGILIAEDSISRVKWTINSTPGNHVIPFANATGSHFIPDTVIYNSGAALGTISIGTYPSPGNAPANYPPGVTHLNNTVGLNNAAETVDRYWLVSRLDSSAATSTTLTFAFADAERPTSLSYPGNPSRAQPWGPAGGWRMAPVGQLYSYFPIIGAPPPTAFATRVHNVRVPNYSWTYGSSNPWAIATTASPLPIKLLSFDAKRADDKVKITWKTASEHNNDYFTVQRTNDFNSHIEIARVQSQGNSNDIQYYDAYDLHPETGLNYYRLLQTDVGGTAEPVSQYVAVRFGVKTTFEILYVKNETDLEVLFDYDNDEPVEYIVTNMLGETIAAGINNTASPGINLLTLDATTWQPGMYLISLQNKEKRVTHKLVY